MSVLLVLFISSGCRLGSNTTDRENIGTRKNTDQERKEVESEDTSERAARIIKESEILFDNGNLLAVFNSPSVKTVFSIDEPRHITEIQNYHWNDEQGKTPGTIAFKSSTGKTYGPWKTEGLPGQGGVPNAYWVCFPDIDLPAGTYEIIDSDTATWSQNDESGNAGISRIYASK